MSGKNGCLVPINYGTTFVFMHLYKTSKTSRHCRAADYRYLLLLLKFILESLFSGEVKEFNQSRQSQPQVTDPSSELVTVANTLLSWYKLYRRITPAKTLDEIATLQQLSHRYLFYYFYYFYYFISFHCLNSLFFYMSEACSMCSYLSSPTKTKLDASSWIQRKHILSSTVTSRF